jgi:hypothetical protein
VDPVAIGAFLSGVGAVISAIVSLRIVQKRARQECEERIAEVRAAIREGYELRNE